MLTITTHRNSKGEREVSINITGILKLPPFFSYYVKSLHPPIFMQDIYAKVYFTHQPRWKRGLTSDKETHDMFTHYKFYTGLIYSTIPAFKRERNVNDTF